MIGRISLIGGTLVVSVSPRLSGVSMSAGARLGCNNSNELSRFVDSASSRLDRDGAFVEEPRESSLDSILARRASSDSGFGGLEFWISAAHKMQDYQMYELLTQSGAI